MHRYEQPAWSLTTAGDGWAPDGGGGEPWCAPCVGVKALMLAMLEDALRSYRGPVEREREEAALWMADRRSHWVFSFPVVCETLGLVADGGARRDDPRPQTHQMVPLLTRSRPNWRRQPGLRIG